MKLNIKKELHAKSPQEIEKQLSEAKRELALMRFEHEQGRVKNTSTLSKKKNEIAVLKTIINEKSAFDKLVDEKPASAKAIAGKEGGKNE